ncbi:DUF3795 domain-containing protein [Anaerostipes sp.]|uniref:DUF3795 domain-containing protein n=1 Tax=Anaerostipes sp. TaxID=1872530 RepID=UPI002ECFD58A|nr:DUF3795 domain-containing protein [Anaerostipes sp.]
MKNFSRKNLLFSLCGLNCGLCPMNIDGYCPGCGGGAGNQSCKTAWCSLEHDKVEYCFQCKEYPCEQYNSIDEFDSFITHQNRQADFKKAEEGGLEFYTAEQKQKLEMLHFLLQNYNDGRRKSFYCTAVNLLDFEDVKMVMQRIRDEIPPDRTGLKERAKAAAEIFQEKASNKWC